MVKQKRQPTIRVDPERLLCWYGLGCLALTNYPDKNKMEIHLEHFMNSEMVIQRWDFTCKVELGINWHTVFLEDLYK